MSDSEIDPSASISSLVDSLPALEDALGPILRHGANLSDKMDKLDPLDRAKLDIMLAYTINDLVWMYLKVRGIDPADHEVTAELDRIKTYYAKVRAVEEPKTERTTKVDVPAAKRFITSSIPASQRRPPTRPSDTSQSHAAADTWPTMPNMPSTSAQGLAREQARRAVNNGRGSGEDERGMDSRFRFISRTTEGFSPDLDSDSEDGESDDDEGEGEGEHGGVEGEVGAGRSTGKHTFFEDDEDDQKVHNGATGEAGVTVANGTEGTSSSFGSKRRKGRKRAEDFT